MFSKVPPTTMDRKKSFFFLLEFAKDAKVKFISKSSLGFVSFRFTKIASEEGKSESESESEKAIVREQKSVHAC